MSTITEQKCKEKCPCCKACKGCTGFQKILDLKKSGLVIYRHTNRIDEINKTTGQLESAVDDVFIIQNTKDSEIKAVDFVSKIVDNISCPRCRALVQRAQKYLKDAPPLNRKDIISVCDHCKTNQQSQNYCCVCHKVAEHFIAERGKQGVAKEQIKQWLSKVQQLLMKLKPHRSGVYSEIYLNKVCEEGESTRLLHVGPMLETGHRMSDSERSINKSTSEIFLDSEVKKLKTVLTTAETLLQIKTHASSSIASYSDSPIRLRSILHRERNTVVRSQKSFKTLRKYYSEDDIFFSTADRDLKKIFSYVFPKEVTEEIKSLRSVKTSAELIMDTREMLRLREVGKSNQQQQRKLLWSGKESKRSELNKEKIKTNKSLETFKSVVSDIPSQKHIKKGVRDKSEKAKTDEKENKNVRDRLEKDKQKLREEKQTASKGKADKKELDEESKLRLAEKKKKEKQEQLLREKEKKQKIKDEQRKVNEEKVKQENLKAKDLKKQEKGEENAQASNLKKTKDVNEEKIKQHNEKEKDLKKQQKVDENYAANLKKMKDEQAKQNFEILILKKQQDENIKQAKVEAGKNTKEDAVKISMEEKQTNIDNKGQDRPKTAKIQEEPTTKELNIAKIKTRKPSQDDLILRLVKLRQTAKKSERRKPQRLSEINITPLMVNDHKIHKGRMSPSCVICVDSDLELDIENIVNSQNKPDTKTTDIVVGTKILKSKLPLSEKPPTEKIIPVLFKSLFQEDQAPTTEPKQKSENNVGKYEHIPLPLLTNKYAEQELPKGVIRYALSDRSFIDKGWTVLPTEKVVRKMNVYRMRPAHPEFDWFDRNKNKRLMLYDTGEKLAEFDDNGRGRWFYRNGKLALDYYDAEEMNAQQRIVIYGSGEPDERGRYQPIAILATFDYLGNGVVFDHTGKIRLKYNQTEGVVLDRSIGPVSHWKWHTLNDPPVLQQVMIDTQMAHKDPDILKLGGPADDKVRPDNEEMLAIEFDNFIKEKSKKLSQKFKPFQIKTKALKINEHFSLRVLDQANIYLIFRDGTTNIKMNIGMLLDHHEIVDTDTAEVGEVSNNLERFPARTDSLAGLQRSVAYAQRVERLRVERERRLRHPEPSSSADKLVAGASRPLRPKLKTVASSSSVINDICYCKCRKPSTNNVYYDTRLV